MMDNNNMMNNNCNMMNNNCNVMNNNNMMNNAMNNIMMNTANNPMMMNMLLMNNMMNQMIVKMNEKLNAMNNNNNNNNNYQNPDINPNDNGQFDDDKLTIIFERKIKKDDKKNIPFKITIMCLKNELLSEVVNRYCNKTLEKKENLLFLFNNKQLKLNRTLMEENLLNGSIIYVIDSSGMKGGF